MLTPEEQVDAQLLDYDKQFQKLIPELPKDTFMVPLLESCELLSSPDLDGWLEDMAEQNTEFKYWRPIKYEKGEKGLKTPKMVCHSKFVAMNCVMANREGKFDFGYKKVEGGIVEDRVYIFKDGEWV